MMISVQLLFTALGLTNKKNWFISFI